MRTDSAEKSVRPSVSSTERGFVLVGVVMFVLALTILGLSLFSLSSYEAQFLGRSSRSTQTLYDAMGGVEWAKMVLAKEKRLDAVQNGQPAEATRPTPRLTDVEAWQNGLTSGNINYGSGAPVRIRALADDGRGEKRMVEVQFTPLVPDETYRNLIDSYEHVEVPWGGGILPPPTTRRPKAFLFGNVRLNDDLFPDWAMAPGAHTTTIGGVALPQVDSFMGQHWGGALEVGEQGSSGKYILSAGANPTFFKTSAGGNPNSIYEDAPIPDITVSGTCVWMVDRGMRFNRMFRVYGTSSDRLVIVAKEVQSTPYDAFPAGYGIRFHTGIDSPNVPVVLVSDSKVRIEHSDQTSNSATVNAISIFARSVYVLGPDSSSVSGQVLSHDSSMDAVIDELIQKNALPNFTTGGNSAFLPIPGTWRELDPDNPS